MGEGCEQPLSQVVRTPPPAPSVKRESLVWSPYIRVVGYVSSPNALRFSSFSRCSPSGVLRIDLHDLLPGGIGAFPVLAVLGDVRQRAIGGEIARFVLHRRLQVGDRARGVAGLVAGDGALAIRLRHRRIEHDRIAEILDRVGHGPGVQLAHRAGHQQHHRRRTGMRPQRADLVSQRPGDRFAGGLLQGVQQLVRLGTVFRRGLRQGERRQHRGKEREGKAPHVPQHRMPGTARASHPTSHPRVTARAKLSRPDKLHKTRKSRKRG